MNDYRTQMGEQGEGNLRRRVHGSCQLDGTPKQSYRVVQWECAPIIVESTAAHWRITCRNDLPSYSVIGYQGKTNTGDGIKIPEIHPGQTVTIDRCGASSLTIYRANGDYVGKWD